MTEADLALAALARRILLLEEQSAVAQTCPRENAVGATSPDAQSELKTLRSQLENFSNEVGVQKSKVEALTVENAKLRYQIKHLTRSIAGKGSAG